MLESPGEREVSDADGETLTTGEKEQAQPRVRQDRDDGFAQAIDWRLDLVLVELGADQDEDFVEIRGAADVN
jgi:hypothetical protein